jgi:hypothetical protein
MVALMLPEPGPALDPIREEALSRANACPWASVDDLVRREARYLALLQSLYRLTASVEASCLLATLLSCYDALYRSALIAEGHLQDIRSQIERMQAKTECPVILSTAHARELVQMQEALAEALEVRDLLGDWREDLRERAG